MQLKMAGLLDSPPYTGFQGECWKRLWWILSHPWWRRFLHELSTPDSPTPGSSSSASKLSFWASTSRASRLSSSILT